MTRKEIKSTAKLNLKKRLGISLLANIICDIITAVSSSFFAFIGLIFAGPLEVGLQKIYYKNSQHEMPKLKDLFSPFQENFGETFLLGLLTRVFLLFWTLLLIVPGIIKSYSYAMSGYLLMRNPELGAIESINQSRKLMDGEKWNLFKLDLSFIGWILLGIITLGIGFIFITPYIFECRTVFFNELYDRKFIAPETVSEEIPVAA